MLKPAVIARSGHRWLGLLVGIQVAIWLATGLYMVIVDIDFIHGDPLVRNTRQAVRVPDATQTTVAALMDRYPGVTRISLQPVMGKTFYAVRTFSGRYLIDPDDGSLVAPLDEHGAVEIARYHFAGDAPVSRATLITSNPPTEIQTRALPLWRVDFDDRYATSFYIDPELGTLVTRRHRYWRIFDFAWMLHIMDYENREDAHHPLLIGAQASGLVFVISGLWLLFYSFSGPRKQR